MSFAEKIFATTLFVADKEVAKTFYERVLEKQPIYEDENSVVFKFGELLINLLVDSEAPELIGPALVASRESGSRYQFTIQVEDVDAQVKRLAALGVSLTNGPLDRPWGIRTLLFADPDGHLWEFAK
jgi:catechol 2,3-dioxygenase-like lactoylglutathione lyase family enzyme